jgi:hypothetical protein
MFDFATITESFTLPSLGKFNGIDPHITLRSMTGNEEKRRLSNSSNGTKIMASIINDCIIDKPKNFDSYDLCLEDFVYLEYMLRAVTYGTDYPVEIICPHCGARNSFTMDLEKLEIVDWDEAKLEDKFNVELPVTKTRVQLKLVTARDIDWINVKAGEALARSNGKNIGDPKYIYNLQVRIQSINGQPQVESIVTQFLNELPMKDLKVLENNIRNLNSWGLILNKVPHLCDKCNKVFTFPMPINRDFFDPQYL